MNLNTLKTFFGTGILGMLLLVGGGPAWAVSEGDKHRMSLSMPTPEEIVSLNTENPIDHFSRFYSEAFQKTLNRRHLGVAIFFNDLSQGYFMNNGDPWMMDEAEEQARRLAREALYIAIQDTLNDVHFLHRVKEYGRSLSSAEIQVREGEIDFEGPSLSKAGRDVEAQGDLNRQDFFHSRLMVSAGLDLGLSWRTTFGPIESKLTYFVISDEIWGATISRKLTSRSKVDLTYRTGADEQKTFLTLGFSLP